IKAGAGNRDDNEQSNSGNCEDFFHAGGIRFSDEVRLNTMYLPRVQRNMTSLREVRENHEWDVRSLFRVR
ncbi:MAG: hypothetical protein VCB59_07950, partial [Gammaproteobacteria bacterium]